MWKDIDFKSDTISINRQYYGGTLKDPKTEKSNQVIPILPELKPILKEWKLQCKSLKWVFPGSRNDIMDSRAWIVKNY